MKRLLCYLKAYRKECILGPLFKLIEACFELAVPLVVARMIDLGIGGGDRGLIVRSTLLLALLGLLGLACAVSAQYFSAKAATGFASRVRAALFSHLTRFSYAQAEDVGVGGMTTLMISDTQQVQTGVNLTLRLLLRSPFIVFGAWVMASLVDRRLSLIFAVLIPVLAVIVFTVMLSGIPLLRRVQTQLSSVLSSVRENLTGVRVIRAFGTEEAECEKFSARNRILTARQRVAGRVSALLNPLAFVAINLAIVFLIDRGALRVESNTLTVGALVALYNYLSSVLIELVKLANLVINLSKSAACASRIADTLQRPAGEDETQQGACDAEPDFGADAVCFDDVTVQYHKDADAALSNLTFSVKSGETVGIIGGTGSGKSTLVNLIPCFYDATEGEVRVFGHPVSAYRTEQLRRLCGVVPQKAQLFSGTIRENLLYGNSDADDDALWDALEAAQCADVVRAKNGGLDAPVEQNGRNFSGGQRQRLSIARALVRRPNILILDDAASALDFATEAALRRSIAALPFHPTVFSVSQRTSAVMHADRIVVLDDGHVAAIGTHTELLESCPVYREICESQIRMEGGDAV